MMHVEDLIRSRWQVFSLKEDMTVHEAARYLRDHQLRAAGVVDSDGKLIGVISQSDISAKVAAENRHPGEISVAEIMTRQLVTVSPDIDLNKCLRRMKKHGIYHLLVVDSLGDFQGMISVTDLLEVIASDEKARADMFEALLFPQR